MEEIKKKPKPIATIVGFAVGMIVMAVVVSFVGSRITGGLSENQLHKELAKFNKELPQQVDEITLLDSITAPSTNQLNYYYTVDDEIVDWSQFNTDVMNEAILRIVRTEPSLNVFRKNNFTWKYFYSNHRGQRLYEYTVTPQMYK